MQQTEVKTKVTDIQLPKQYKTYIDDDDNLIIEKKLFEWRGLLECIILTIVMPLFCLTILLLPSNGDYGIFEHVIITMKNGMKQPIVIVVALIPIILFFIAGTQEGINILFNTIKISVGSLFLDVSVYPIKLLHSRVFNVSIQDILKIYCQKKTTKNHVFYALSVDIKKCGEITIGTFYSLEEAQALEILIRKRLELENKNMDKVVA